MYRCGSSVSVCAHLFQPQWKPAVLLKVKLECYFGIIQTLPIFKDRAMISSSFHWNIWGPPSPPIWHYRPWWWTTHSFAIPGSAPGVILLHLVQREILSYLSNMGLKWAFYLTHITESDHCNEQQPKAVFPCARLHLHLRLHLHHRKSLHVAIESVLRRRRTHATFLSTPHTCTTGDSPPCVLPVTWSVLETPLVHHGRVHVLCHWSWGWKETWKTTM